MENKSMQVVFKRAIVAVFFIIFGAAVLLFIGPSAGSEIFGFFFLLVGGLFFIHSCLSYFRYKKTGEIKPVLDERLEMNSLKASRKGFVAIITLIATLMILKAFGIIDETIFVALIAPAFALSMLAYIAFYFYYEGMG